MCYVQDSGLLTCDTMLRYFLGETRSEWFSKINPMRRVPVMEDTKFKLTERCKYNTGYWLAKSIYKSAIHIRSSEILSTYPDRCTLKAIRKQGTISVTAKVDIFNLTIKCQFRGK